MINTKNFTAVLFALVFFAVNCAAQIGDAPIKGFTFEVDAQTDYVDVMNDEMPALPAFPSVSKKAGYVRGYVKNVAGEPIAGAKIGLKSARMYDAYLANSAETDANGYYEIKIPTGGAKFDYAGITRDIGHGKNSTVSSSEHLYKANHFEFNKWFVYC